jgi:hypothetical protein
MRDRHEKSEISELYTSLQYRICRAYPRVSLAYRTDVFLSCIGERRAQLK